MTKDFLPKTILKVKSATYDSEKEVWTGKDITSFHYENRNLKRVKSRGSQVLDLPFAPDKLVIDRRLPNELSLRELLAKIHRGQLSGVDVLNLEVEFQVKLAFYFAAFVVSFIGLRFGYTSERSTETAKGILLAIAIGISYWFILKCYFSLR